MKQFRDEEYGWIWTEQPDGTYRSPDGKGGYWQEPSLGTLRLWSDTLTRLEDVGDDE